MNPTSAQTKLVKQCINGDRKSQHQLYQSYSQAMFNICLRMMGNREAAEDALQNAFVDVYRRLETFRGDATLGAWIKRIVINHCINMLKKKRLDYTELKDYHGEVRDLHYEAISDPSREVARIKNAMQHLPEGYRVIFSLYALEGYDHREIANILNITEGGSKSQYSRARQKLKMLLSNEERGI